LVYDTAVEHSYCSRFKEDYEWQLA
jgi:hypothetical protein